MNTQNAALKAATIKQGRAFKLRFLSFDGQETGFGWYVIGNEIPPGVTNEDVHLLSSVGDWATELDGREAGEDRITLSAPECNEVYAQVWDIK